MPLGANKNVLVVAAHGDDEVLGCGATIARHTAQGHQVHVVIMADGVSSRYYDPSSNAVLEPDKVRDLIAHRKAETLRAAAVLGIGHEQVHCLGMADQRLDTYPLLMLVKSIEAIKSKVMPQAVYTHFYGDLNNDHYLTCRAVLTAFRPTGQGHDPDIFLFEVPESTHLSVRMGVEFKPDAFQDVSSSMEQKLKALSVYESEKRIYPHQRSQEFIQEWAAKRGLSAGYAFAEAFMKVLR